MKDYVKDLYKKLSENIGETPELFHYDYFKLKCGELYYIGNRKPLTTEGKLKSVGMLADILGKNRLRRLGFNIPVGRITARQTVMLNKAAEEPPCESDITKADDTELQEIAEKASGIISQIKDVQTDTEDLFEHPLQELLGLDKQLRSIRGSLKVKVAEKVELEEHIAKEHCKLEEFREYPGVYDDTMKEDITKRIDDLNEYLKVRQDSIDLLKGRLKNQITSFHETIVKVTPLWLKRSELCSESNQLRSLPYSWLSEWPSEYLLKHYYQVVGVQPRHQVEVANHLLTMGKV